MLPVYAVMQRNGYIYIDIGKTSHVKRQVSVRINTVIWSEGVNVSWFAMLDYI